VLRRELGADGALLYRATGMSAVEGAFVACSFWMVECLARIGCVEEAVAAMDALVALPGPTGLLSEQVDPRTGALLGNLPQALSHLALIDAAVAIGRTAGPLANHPDPSAGAPGYDA
jgi:GH15 family glucan-1,4-alpha-glucosidase